MKITVKSDIHLEFGPADAGKGDVLLLCGDICTAYDIKSSGPMQRRYLKFFEDCAENYNKVFYIMGNHEHYEGDILESVKTLRKWIHPDITILDNDVVYYRGWHFIGATMWTSLDKGKMILDASLTMNDYHSIRKGGSTLSPNDTIEEYDKSMKFMNELLPTLKDRVIVMSHHAPTRQSINSSRSESTAYAYANELNCFIEDNPCIKYWFHGHVHDSNDYMIGETRVISNPRGYYNIAENKEYEENLVVECDTPTTGTSPLDMMWQEVV